MEKVNINLRPTAEKLNLYDVYVQGVKSYKILEMHKGLDKITAFSLFETLRNQYVDSFACEFK
jgi:hypothetical protein